MTFWFCQSYIKPITITNKLNEIRKTYGDMCTQHYDSTWGLNSYREGSCIGKDTHIIQTIHERSYNLEALHDSYGFISSVGDFNVLHKYLDELPKWRSCTYPNVCERTSTSHSSNEQLCVSMIPTMKMKYLVQLHGNN